MLGEKSSSELAPKRLTVPSEAPVSRVGECRLAGPAESTITLLAPQRLVKAGDEMSRLWPP